MRSTAEESQLKVGYMENDRLMNSATWASGSGNPNARSSESLVSVSTAAAARYTFSVFFR